MKKQIFVLSLLSGLLFSACDVAKSSAVTTTSPSTEASSKNENAAAANSKTNESNKTIKKIEPNAAPVHAPASSLERAPGKN